MQTLILISVSPQFGLCFASNLCCKDSFCLSSSGTVTDLFGDAPLSKSAKINNCTCSEITCESHLLEFLISLNGADHGDAYF